MEVSLQKKKKVGVRYTKQHLLKKRKMNFESLGARYSPEHKGNNLA